MTIFLKSTLFYFCHQKLIRVIPSSLNTTTTHKDTYGRPAPSSDYRGSDNEIEEVGVEEEVDENIERLQIHTGYGES